MDDNLYYYNQLIEKVNRAVLYPLSQLGILPSYIKKDTVLSFASLNKAMNGSPHEHHSYLLEHSIKALGVRLMVPPSNTKVKTAVEDLAK